MYYTITINISYFLRFCCVVSEFIYIMLKQWPENLMYMQH